MDNITVLNKSISTKKINQDDYISITDIAKYKDEVDANDIIKNWFRNRNTIEFLGLWEKLNNADFKPVEFDLIKNDAGLNSFTMSAKKWCEKTGAIGVISKSGRYGGTYAHKDIAFEFASWVSVELKLYLIKEFQRLKEEEYKQLGWDIKRNLTKINYRIHTDAIKNNIIPNIVNQSQINYVYASEADILNIALFGQTAKEFKESNPTNKGNIRDYADVSQLVCLANLESLNALFIEEGLSQAKRLIKLNQVAINQMKILVDDKNIEYLKAKE
ncbi:KilA, N-terminal/APSES-type HTH DNA-binding domain protein [Arcobacter nitrofigilis DSM 7299]|uniref:KilA, N-terminal/APSES-type HTH DNA-binding domain protein n=1 Tax=Arcobacter nitrofigilis (strain ATCC 33309 / DSM 7299 / CCUG 15893 / LMG 7604 / NCTC 12251 / CI) TaxID=572480 RepID=D5V7D5_ARCNC|nr:KilA-N domain-containing protein [Arcobacter nitrofigilis]ADG94555.1 KilA, N-terminal/APSES-type HTH DNA-binding domain protein [Arcobacter nitrofigilis DSM 7299]